MTISAPISIQAGLDVSGPNLAHTELRELLYATLRGRPDPVLVGPGFAIPGASLWSGMRLWSNALRHVGAKRGAAMVLAVPPSPAYVMACAAAWWEGLCVCPVDWRLTDTLHDELSDTFGMVVYVTEQSSVHHSEHGPSTCWLGFNADNRPVLSNGTECSPIRSAPGPLSGLNASAGCAGALPAIAALFGSSNSGASWHDVVAACRPSPFADEETKCRHAWHTRAGCLGELWPGLMSKRVVHAPLPDPLKRNDRRGVFHPATHQLRGAGGTA